MTDPDERDFYAYVYPAAAEAIRRVGMFRKRGGDPFILDWHALGEALQDFDYLAPGPTIRGVKFWFVTETGLSASESDFRRAAAHVVGTRWARHALSAIQRDIGRPYTYNYYLRSFTRKTLIVRERPPLMARPVAFRVIGTMPDWRMRGTKELRRRVRGVLPRRWLPLAG